MIRRTLVLLVLVLAAPVAARAGGFSTFGPHFGFSSDPGQVVVGGHLQMGDVAPDLDFVPSVDLGLGGGTTTIAFNGDFHYRLKLADMRWQPYVGGGVSLYTASGAGAVGAGSFIFGADVPTQSGSRFFAEGKLGIGDGPTFKALAGWSFKLR